MHAVPTQILRACQARLRSPQECFRSLRTISVILICGLSFWDSDASAQDEPLGQKESGPAMNLKTGGNESHTNAPGSLLTEEVATQLPANLRPFQLVLPRGHLFDDWLGLRTKAEQSGISPTLAFVTDIAGNVTGGKNQGIEHADNLGLDLLFDLNKLAGLEGGSFLASVSQRSGSSLSREHVGNVFTIQQVYGGQTFHLIDLAYQQKLLDDRLEFRLGRLATGDDFLVSPYDWLFMQNAFDGNPVGIFFNSPGMTAYPNATWGALLKVRPNERTYVMGGVYSGDPEIRRNSHNGADMSMNGPVFVIGEAGYHRNGLTGDTGFLGNYRIGGWYDNASFTDFESAGRETPTASKRGNWGLYTLNDQVVMLFGDRTNNAGLGVVCSAEVSPDESISQMPYFFTAGVVARSFLPSRPADVAGFGVIFGRFSSDLRDAQHREQLFDPTVAAQDYESVLEWTYKFYFHNNALFFQPDIQYVINPGGGHNLDNALVLGCQIGINF
jgi:porin